MTIDWRGTWLYTRTSGESMKKLLPSFILVSFIACTTKVQVNPSDTMQLCYTPNEYML